MRCLGSWTQGGCPREKKCEAEGSDDGNAREAGLRAFIICFSDRNLGSFDRPNRSWAGQCNKHHAGENSCS
jgi:hypothetical protein